MGLMEQANKDARRFLSGEWSEVFTFTTPDKTTFVSIRGLASSHHLSIDPNSGLPVNARNTHVSIKEKDLTDAGYAVRNSAGEISLIRHLVTYKSKTYKIDETYPDETLGVIICILGSYE